jgi:hypothetical protein
MLSLFMILEQNSQTQNSDLQKNPADILQHMKNVLADKAQWHVVYFFNYFRVQQRSLNLVSGFIADGSKHCFMKVH